MTTLLTKGRDPTDVVIRRALAWILDSALDLLVILAAIGLFGVEVERTSTTGTLYDSAGADSAALAAIALTSIGWAAGKVLTVAFFGWTPGKLALAVRVARWDGRPPGFLRALARGAAVVVLGFFGCLYWIVGLAMMALTREHRQPADFVAGTWVIDSMLQGRLILHGPSGALVGPPSVTRAEAAQLAAERNLPTGSLAGSPGPKSTKPFHDSQRDTYVVWTERKKAWFQFDKSAGEWVPLR